MSDEIKPQYGFQLCGAGDPSRTHWLANINGDYQWLECSHPNDCHKFNHQKPILLPDGERDGESAEWELVKEDESYSGDTNPAVFGEGRWHMDWPTKPDCCNTFKTHKEKHPDSKIVAFARRKASPGTDGWVSVKDRLPSEHERVLAIGNGTPFVGALTAEGWKDVHTQLLRDPHHWMPLPAPPAPEKSEAERLADEYVESRNIRNSGYETAVHRGYMAGYEAGRRG